VEPLSKALGLEIDTRDRNDTKGAAEAAKAVSGSGNILICWEHHQLSKIAEVLGVKSFADATGFKGKPDYPDDRFDLIWVVPPPYHEITEVKSEKVPGLDDGLTVGN
jgi:hypothetical protein